MTVEETVAMLQRMFDVATPRHAVVFHPDDEEAVREAARGYHVTLESSSFVKPGMVYLIDRHELERVCRLRLEGPLW